MAQQPYSDLGLQLVDVSKSQTQYNRYDSSGCVIDPSQSPLPDYSQPTNVYASGGIRTRNPSKLAAADRRLTRTGDRDQELSIVII
jgi:hypothetical protein